MPMHLTKGAYMNSTLIAVFLLSDDCIDVKKDVFGRRDGVVAYSEHVQP
jgi:hypothetical protein